MERHRRFVQILQACSRHRSLNTTKPLHALAITLGPNTNQHTFLLNNIISLYGLRGELSMARKVFEQMPEINIVSHNSIISCYSKYDCSDESWLVFCELMYRGFRPNHFTLAGLLSCASMTLCCGVQVLALAVKNGLFLADAFVGTALMGLFGRRGRLDEAFDIFEFMPIKSLVTWNLMMSLFGGLGFAGDCMVLFRQLVREKISLTDGSFVAILSGLVCEKDLALGEQIHSLIVKIGFDSDLSVMNSITNMYAKCTNIDIVEKTFEGVVGRDVVTWNTTIGALAKSKKPIKALELFYRMPDDGIMPNQTSFVSVISSCTHLQIPMIGELFHAKIIRNSFETDVYVGSALVDYYAKWNKLDDAHSCFVEICEKNSVSWNALILGYANNCSPLCISLLREMLRFGYQPNEFSFSAVLKLSPVLELQQLHSQVIRMGHDASVYVLSSLITSYGRNGLISEALVFLPDSGIPFATVTSNNIAAVYNRLGQYHETLKLFSQLEEPDIVSWNIVIAACVRKGNYKEGLELFKRMHMVTIRPDNYTYVSILSMCTKLSYLALGSSLHGLLIKTNFSSCDTFVCNVLIDMYGKCGSLGSSVKIFNSMIDRNLITWTALISALGINGLAHKAVETFKEMECQGFRPDKVAFLAVLTACQHGGLVREGIELFEKMDMYGIETEMDHYHCIVDLLARHGFLRESEIIISRMPYPPNAIMWRSFLEGCQRHGTAKDLAMASEHHNAKSVQ